MKGSFNKNLISIKKFTKIEIFGYLLSFINPFPLGVFIGIFMYFYENRKYVESGKRIIIFSIIWLIIVIIWNYTIGISIQAY